jgi:hypothetical protein
LIDSRAFVLPKQTSESLTALLRKGYQANAFGHLFTQQVTYKRPRLADFVAGHLCIVGGVDDDDAEKRVSVFRDVMPCFSR